MKKLALSLALSGSCALAVANTITYTLSGVITASPTDAIEVGSDFSFVASIDSGALPDWAPYAGRYESAMMENSALLKFEWVKSARSWGAEELGTEGSRPRSPLQQAGRVDVESARKQAFMRVVEAFEASPSRRYMRPPLAETP